eukprot:353273-Chlamydomonas_euryale.AAC.4
MHTHTSQVTPASPPSVTGARGLASILASGCPPGPAGTAAARRCLGVGLVAGSILAAVHVSIAALARPGWLLNEHRRVCETHIDRVLAEAAEAQTQLLKRRLQVGGWGRQQAWLARDHLRRKARCHAAQQRPDAADALRDRRRRLRQQARNHLQQPLHARDRQAQRARQRRGSRAQLRRLCQQQRRVAQQQRHLGGGGARGVRRRRCTGHASDVGRVATAQQLAQRAQPRAQLARRQLQQQRLRLRQLRRRRHAHPQRLGQPRDALRHNAWAPLTHLAARRARRQQGCQRHAQLPGHAQQLQHAAGAHWLAALCCAPCQRRRRVDRRIEEDVGVDEDHVDDVVLKAAVFARQRRKLGGERGRA